MAAGALLCSSYFTKRIGLMLTAFRPALVAPMAIFALSRCFAM